MITMLYKKGGKELLDVPVDRGTALYLTGLNSTEVSELFALSNRIRVNFRGNKIDLCSIVNAKSGACPEDCFFCAQSARSKADIKVYPLPDRHFRKP